MIEPTGVCGVYSDPSPVVVYAPDGARQQVAICFHAVPRGDGVTGRPDHVETSHVEWFDPVATGGLRIHESVRQRLIHALVHPDTVDYE